MTNVVITCVVPELPCENLSIDRLPASEPIEEPVLSCSALRTGFVDYGPKKKLFKKFNTCLPLNIVLRSLLVSSI